MDCRRRAVDDRRRADRDADLDAAREHAAAQWAMPGLRDAPVVWLADHDRRLVPLADEERDRQRAFLLGLGCVPEGPDPDQVAAPAGQDGEPSVGNRLCALCAGRCCHTGGQQFAYLRGASLRRWLSSHPGKTWADAVDGYMSLVPPHHVADSCLHHGERGCTLPREMRSDTCNDFACDPLERVEALARLDPAVAVVAGIVRDHAMVDAALLSAQESSPLPEAARRP